MKKLISTVTGIAMLASVFSVSAVPTAFADDTQPVSGDARQVEYLNRGLVAVKVEGGVFLSWRLKGDEPLDQTFDIYKNGELYVSGVDATNYTDTEGFSYDTYQVVLSGTAAENVDSQCALTEVWTDNYYDIPLNKPDAGVIKYTGETYTYSVNDASVADVDGDGDLEYIIKWDPSNSQDSSTRGYTGNVLIDAYESDGTQLWRIDLGQNIRAGAHYTQFIVYDFDGDGKAEMAVKTAAGTKDGEGKYVNETGVFSGDYEDNSKENVTQKSGKSQGMVLTGAEYLTMFDGETGKALHTINYPIARGKISDWGDSYGGRSERYLAAVAYLNGTTPTLIETRGYYEKAAMSALNWSRENGFSLQWTRIYTRKSDGTREVTDENGSTTQISSSQSLYGQGTHNISVCDADNDGKDEIVFGSAVMDDNGEVLNSTGHGHGDALHVSDFNNDGEQEVFQVHEDSNIAEDYGAEYRKAGTGEVISAYGRRADVGRGCMDNIDDSYASQNADGMSLFWCSASTNLFDLAGNTVKKKVNVDGSESSIEVSAPSDTNFFVYWDGDLSRELLDKTRIDKFTVDNGTERLENFQDVHSNNGTKATPALCADLFGDWREEVAFGTSDDTALRIFTTTDPTEYKLTTLMHDTQYRESVAWQNVGYNQPTHQSYYVGSASLAQGKNYLAPQSGFDSVYYPIAPELKMERESKETVVYTANSFNDGSSEGFTNVDLRSQAAPYNNVAMTTDESELDMRYIFDSSYTEPPKTTPEPPKPTAEPLYTVDFEDSAAGTTILAFGTDGNAAVPPNSDYAGMEFYIGNRKDGDGTTYIAVESGGNPGNAAAMHSGRFAGSNRAPRVKLITPEITPNTEVIATLDVKADSGNALYYNDSTATQGNSLICSGDETWHQLKIVLATDSSGKTTRTIYVDEEEISSDSASALPVLWAAPDNVNTAVRIDNYSVRIEEVEPDPTEPPTEAPTEDPTEPPTEAPTEDPTEPPTQTPTEEVPTQTPDIDSCVRIEARYNDDGTLAGVEITDNVPVQKETPESFTKVFYWQSIDSMVPVAMYEGSFDEEIEVFENTISAVEGVIDDTTTDNEEIVTADKEGTYKVAFDWKPGSTVQLSDENGSNIVTISKNNDMAMTYKVGASEEKVLHSTLLSQNSWYHVEFVIDLAAKTIDISVIDYTNNSDERSVYSVSFAGADGYIASMKVGKGAYIDNVRMTEIEYLVDMTLFSFNVSDTSGSPIEGATVKLGSNTITTDASGHAAIKLKSDSYTYTVTKAAYKSASGVMEAPEAAENIDVTLAAGEERNIYVNYVFGDVNITPVDQEGVQTPELVGTAYENTSYTVADSVKLKDISYTFPTDDITPGYEDYAGKTYTFEYDADASTSNNIIVGEGADTYINLSYKIKRVPTETDTEVLDINFGEDGYESVADSWSAGMYEYAVDEAYGTKYAEITGLNTNKLSVKIPEYSSDNIVIEFDISFRDLSWGGNYYGVTPYSGSSEGQCFGLRTSSEGNSQWQWFGNDYMAYTVGNDKGYTYSYNWKDRWAHVVMAAVPSENKFNISVVNKDSGVVYMQDVELPFANGVGGSDKHITELRFGTINGTSGSVNDTIGIANLKAYTIGIPDEITEETMDVYPGMSTDISADYHAADFEGMEFAVNGMFDVSYEFENEPGVTVEAPQGIKVENGILIVDSSANIDDMPKYVTVKYDGKTVKRYAFNWMNKVFKIGNVNGFDNGDVSPFSLTNMSGYSLSCDSGQLLYSRNAGTANNADVVLGANLVNGQLADNFVFSFDYRVDKAQYKGYMYIQDSSGNDIVKMETHVYSPRIKIFQDVTDGSSNKDFRNPNFELGKTYTFVFRGQNFNSDNKTVICEIYNKGDYDYATDTATGDTVIDPITIVSAPGCTNNGLRFKYQVAQNTGSSAADGGDMQYFDNFAYCYYDFE